ncbi:MAG: hypothetical protein ACI9MR_004973, partial [Myxococcota bacterium]
QAEADGVASSDIVDTIIKSVPSTSV